MSADLQRYDVLRYAAFTATPDGGNPAGVVLDARTLTDEQMQVIAAEVGFSETAFVLGPVATHDGPPGRHLTVRYFSPRAEVSFCGHATIATAVAWAERHGLEPLVLHTPAGVVPVEVRDGEAGLTATLTSVPPRVDPADDADVDEALAALGWHESDLDPALPPRVAFAGASHLVLAAATRQRLGDLDYDFPRLDALMNARGWTTVQLVWRESAAVFHARNPFPPGGVVEDPATGAAAAALGGYLRALALVDVPASLTVHQGDDLGRPSLLRVDVPADPASGIRVSGHAVPMS